MGKIATQLKHAWNAFTNQDLSQRIHTFGGGASYGGRSDRLRFSYSNERSIIASIYTRLGIDVAAVELRHVRLDDEDQYVETIDDGLNQCITVEANIDQGGTAFRQDIAMTLFDKGVVAIVPVDTTLNPSISGSYDINTMRVGEIVAWYPRHVRVNLYNDVKGVREELTLEKKYVAIVENPLYSVMNEPNSTLRRLIHKLNLLDVVDEQSSSGKLDLLLQLPFVVKSEARRDQAKQRLTDIEFQLQGSKHGIAYVDATEKITQLNRPVENGLLAQITTLTTLLYSQLGLTDEIMNGTADEATMLNYMNRTIMPITEAIVEAMKRTFLTKTARSQKQSIASFYDPFKFVPIAQIADIADKFSRNKILSANELRAKIGVKPSKDPEASKLVNSNMPQPGPSDPNQAPPTQTEGDGQNGSNQG